jgi:ABC-type multidrug transport system fused ATPase/permease subunit
VTGSRQLLLPFLRRRWRALAVAALSTLAVAAAELARPFPMALVIDHLFAGWTPDQGFELGEDDAVLLAGVAALVLAIALVDGAASYLMDVHLNRAGERIVHDLRVAVYAHLQRLSLLYHQGRHTGDLVTRVTGDVNAVGALFSSSAGNLVTAVITLVGMVVVGLILDPVLTLVAFASSPLLAVLAFRFRRRMKAIARQQRSMEGEIASMASEALSSIRQVKALGSESHEYDRLERKSEERLAAGYEATRVEARFTRVIDVLGAIGTALVLVVGVLRVDADALSPGDLVVMLTYTRRIYKPLRDIAREAGRISRSMARADRLAEILAADALLAEPASVREDGRAKGELEFAGVTFEYERGRPALRDVSLQIRAGERVALVGRSGAGKSTLIALAARFHDPTGGAVLIDGRDARSHTLAWLRAEIGLVLQDTVLFTGTVAENIAYGTEASAERIVEAAKAAGAHAFICELPERYDTELGPRGVALSGGQRQRIAIARTLLRDPSVLLLDEPTTGLDAESEAQVLAGLDVLVRGRTTVVVTHSLALARRAGRAVVLERGDVVQEGPPEELLAADGPFRHLAAEQGLVEPAPARRVRAPLDRDLPQLRAMLDPDAIAPVLQRSLDSGAVPDVRVRYLRYKPGTNLTAQYDVRTNGGWHDAVVLAAPGRDLGKRAGKPEHRALAELVRGRAPTRQPLAFDPDLGAMVQWYPLDLWLPALAEPPARLRQRLRDAGVRVAAGEGEPALLNYKPRRRAVLGLDGHVIKLYAAERDFTTAANGLILSDSMRSIHVAPFRAVVPELRLTVQGLVAGAAPGSAADAATEAGELLASLHRARPQPLSDELRRLGPGEQLEAAAGSAGLVSTIAPQLRSRLDVLLARLRDAAPGAPVLVHSHGDFHAGQLVDDGRELAVIDFDEMCLAPPALDLATYAAHVVRGAPEDGAAAAMVLDGLLDGYADRPDGLAWYLATAILRRAPFPFRYLDERWEERVDAMVGAAEEALAP